MEYVNSLNAIKSTRTVSQVTKKTRSPTQIITCISLETVRTRIIFLHVRPQVLYYKCVKLHQYWFIGKGRVAFTRHLDSQMDRRICLYFLSLPKPGLVYYLTLEWWMWHKWSDSFHRWDVHLHQSCQGHTWLWYRWLQTAWDSGPMLAHPRHTAL